MARVNALALPAIQTFNPQVPLCPSRSYIPVMEYVTVLVLHNNDNK